MKTIVAAITKLPPGARIRLIIGPGTFDLAVSREVARPLAEQIQFELTAAIAMAIAKAQAELEAEEAVCIEDLH
jgi:hypothetical protein